MDLAAVISAFARLVLLVRSCLKSEVEGAPGGAQSVETLTLDFSSGHGLGVREIESCIGLRAEGWEPACDSLPLSLCPSPAHTLFLSK